MSLSFWRVKLVVVCFATLLLPAVGCRRAATTPAAVPAAGTPVGSFKSPAGKVYARTLVGPPDNDEPPVRAPMARRTGAAGGDDYAGSSRMAAKLSVASGTPETFDGLGPLLDSLPSDESMRALHIDEGPDSGRLPQEQHVVVVKAFIYASSKESDNDFHCIAGPDPTQPPRYMNVEVSGLPPASSQFFTLLTAARNEFKAFFSSGTDALPTRGYEKYDPPIPVTITGSLFFDVDHVPPAVGPTGMKPQTAWEIHPVSDMQFEP
jgi:hypothetical protein